MIDFSNKGLCARYGSWVRAQVAFYDFLFQEGMKVHPTCFNQAALAEAIAGHEFSDGGNLYERAIERISQVFPTQADAWNKFVEQSLS